MENYILQNAWAQLKDIDDVSPTKSLKESLNEAKDDENEFEGGEFSSDDTRAWGSDEDSTWVWTDDMSEEDEEDEEDYTGKVVLECNICHGLAFKDEDEIKFEDEDDKENCNFEDTCPYCQSTNTGFTIAGQIVPFSLEDIEDEEDSEEDGLEDDDAEIFDFDFDGDESLNEATPRPMRYNRKRDILEPAHDDRNDTHSSTNPYDLEDDTISSTNPYNNREDDDLSSTNPYKFNYDGDYATFIDDHSDYSNELSKQVTNVYTDNSGSAEFNDDFRNLADTLDRWLLRMLGHEVQLKKYAFASRVSSSSSRDALGGGGTNPSALIKHIQETSPDNVVIISDNDLDYDYHNDKLTASIPGEAIFVWTDGRRAGNFVKRIHARHIVEVDLKDIGLNGEQYESLSESLDEGALGVGSSLAGGGAGAAIGGLVGGPLGALAGGAIGSGLGMAASAPADKVLDSIDGDDITGIASMLMASDDKERGCDSTKRLLEDESQDQAKNGWQKEGDGYYYYSDGQKLTNQWINEKDGSHYVGADGKMLTNTKTPDGYWVGSDGAWFKGIKTPDGWTKRNEDWFYYNDGQVVTNQWVGDYYLGADGKMLKNASTPDGQKVGADGKRVNGGSGESSNSSNSSSYVRSGPGFANDLKNKKVELQDTDDQNYKKFADEANAKKESLNEADSKVTASAASDPTSSAYNSSQKAQNSTPNKGATAKSGNAGTQYDTGINTANTGKRTNINSVQHGASERNNATASNVKDAGNLAAGNLKSGSSGDRVTSMQNALRQKGYEVTASGTFDDQTKQALMQFQKDNGLQVDGIYGEQTKAALHGSVGQKQAATKQATPQQAAAAASNKDTATTTSTSATQNRYASNNTATQNATKSVDDLQAEFDKASQDLAVAQASGDYTAANEAQKRYNQTLTALTNAKKSAKAASDKAASDTRYQAALNGEEINQAEKELQAAIKTAQSRIKGNVSANTRVDDFPEVQAARAKLNKLKSQQ